MIKQWKDIKVGDVMKDGSIVTQIHNTHNEDACKVIYDTDREFICSLTHILLIDVKNLPPEGIEELNKYCTFVPLEEDYSVFCDEELTLHERSVVDRFCHNEPIEVKVKDITTAEEVEEYEFMFKKPKKVRIKNIIIKSEPQKVNEHTFWLPCKGIKYLMDKYNVDLYCNDLIINKIELLGKLPCFCISTNTGRYET